MDTNQNCRVIKRYSNRKLYDTQESRYVTLDEVSSMVKAGDQVQIIDNRTGEDLTGVTLAQILFEEQKKHPKRMPLELLQEMIRTRGAALAEFIQSRASQPVQNFKQEVERKVDHFLRISENTMEDAGRQAKEYLSVAHQNLDDFLEKLDDRLHSMIESARAAGFVKEQLTNIKNKIEEIESRIRNL